MLHPAGHMDLPPLFSNTESVVSIDAHFFPVISLSFSDPFILINVKVLSYPDPRVQMIAVSAPVFSVAVQRYQFLRKKYLIFLVIDVFRLPTILYNSIYDYLVSLSLLSAQLTKFGRSFLLQLINGCVCMRPASSALPLTYLPHAAEIPAACRIEGCYLLLDASVELTG